MDFHRFRPWTVALIALTAMALVMGDADARIGGGRSFGSRGARTFSMPPVTRTAPTTAAPIQRSITQPGPSNIGGTAANRPLGGFFGRPGLFGGLAAGFLGAGLFGLLFGHGFFGGIGGLGSLFGLLLQIALVVLVARLAWAWWQRRNTPAFAAAPGRSNSYARDGFFGLGAASGSAAAAGSQAAPTIGPEDYEAFEEQLREIQLAYGREDINALRQRVTPEMLSYFSEDFSDNASQGVVNRISDVRLLQGDLAEAWREGGAEYATVAMRFSLVDQTVDRNTGKVLDGDAAPVEVTELWTFRRSGGGRWLLSAIQQS